MSFASCSVPEEVAALRQFAVSMQTAFRELEQNARLLKEENKLLRREATANKAEIYDKAELIEKLRAELDVLKRDRFGRSSEKLERRIDQLEFALEELEIDLAEERHEQERGKNKPTASSTVPSPEIEAPAKSRRAFPSHLPRERIEHKPACVCPECGGTKLVCIGTDEREVLEYVPSHFKVIVHVRPKMSCRACEKITQAPMPSLPIVRGMPGPALLAHVLTGKFCDHIPLNRQETIMGRTGVPVDKSTMVDWVARCADLVEPLAEAIGKHVRACETVHADDTTVKVLVPGLGRARTGRLWVAVRDERPWGSAVPPAAYYRYSPDRKAAQAEALLKGCRGYLHADGYSGFNRLYAVDKISGRARLAEVACFAHARRKLYDVYEREKSPAALDLLHRIGALFAIEAEIKGHSPQERLAVRQSRSVPLLQELTNPALKYITFLAQAA